MVDDGVSRLLSWNSWAEEKRGRLWRLMDTVPTTLQSSLANFVPPHRRPFALASPHQFSLAAVKP